MRQAAFSGLCFVVAASVVAASVVAAPVVAASVVAASVVVAGCAEILGLEPPGEGTGTAGSAGSAGGMSDGFLWKIVT